MEDDESLSMNSLLLNPAPDPAFVSATCFLGLDFFCFFDFSLREKQQTLTTVAIWGHKTTRRHIFLDNLSTDPETTC